MIRGENPLAWYPRCKITILNHNVEKHYNKVRWDDLGLYINPTLLPFVVPCSGKKKTWRLKSKDRNGTPKPKLLYSHSATHSKKCKQIAETGKSKILKFSTVVMEFQMHRASGCTIVACTPIITEIYPPACAFETPLFVYEIQIQKVSSHLFSKFYQNGCPRSLLSFHWYKMSCYHSWKTSTIQNTLHSNRKWQWDLIRTGRIN